jgi:hypothetical protein
VQCGSRRLVDVAVHESAPADIAKTALMIRTGQCPTADHVSMPVQRVIDVIAFQLEVGVVLRLR